MSSSPNQHPNPTIFARARAMRGGLRLAVRSQRVGALACLVALCGIIFGVGAAFAHPGGRHARAAHVWVRAADRGGRAHRGRVHRFGVRAYRRGHRGRRHHKHARRLYMRRMEARAAHARAARARARRAHAARARRAHAAAARRRHRKQRHGKHGRRLMMRAFVPGLTTTASLGQSLPGSLIAVARPGSGSLVATPSVSRATGAVFTGSGSTQVGALAAQVRTAATTGTYSGHPTGTRAHVAVKPAHKHSAGGHGSARR